MTNYTHPQDPYITAITDALTAVGLPTGDTWTSDAETIGMYCHLSAVVTLDPDRTADLDHEDIPAGADWPHGLILIWEWHTGLEDRGPERGPIWLFAEVNADGSNWEPSWLPVEGYASPAAVVEAARAVIARTITAAPGGMTTGEYEENTERWDSADQLELVCAAWSDREEESGNPAVAQQSGNTPGTVSPLALRSPAGPRAARDVATRHVAAGHHTHLSTDGETECLSGRCNPTTLPMGA